MDSTIGLVSALEMKGRDNWETVARAALVLRSYLRLSAKKFGLFLSIIIFSRNNEVMLFSVKKKGSDGY